MALTNTRIQSQLVILPPCRGVVPKQFRRIQANNGQYDGLFTGMQRFRGKIYCDDGAVGANELTADGRHIDAADCQSWHVLSLDGEGRICACLRYLDESAAVYFDDLWVRNAAMARSAVAPRFRLAVERQMAETRRIHLRFGEVGGWAVAEDRRGTIEALRIILATCGLLEILGGCTGVATATFRHQSTTILRRLGLTPLCIDGVELPPYFDESYGCQMEVLRFDSRLPNPRYREAVAEFTSSLPGALVVCPERDWPTTRVPRPFEVPMLGPAVLPNLVPALAAEAIFGR